MINIGKSFAPVLRSMSAVKPVFLLADSQLLFWQKDGELYLKTILQHVASSSPKAAYIGASNGDIPDFYHIFVAAMKGIGITDCQMISSDASQDELAFLAQSDVLLLSGGDVDKGWDVLQNTGMLNIVRQRYKEGAVIIGISAGAIQLGQFWREDADHAELRPMAQVLPFSIDAHEESTNWKRLKNTTRHGYSKAKAYGIPSGGGLVFFPNKHIHAIRYPAAEMVNQGNTLVVTSLPPREVNQPVLH